MNVNARDCECVLYTNVQCALSSTPLLDIYTTTFLLKGQFNILNHPMIFRDVDARDNRKRHFYKNSYHDDDDDDDVL